MLITGFVSTAEAATYSLKLKRVGIVDRTKVFNDTTGGQKQLFLEFTAPVNFCGRGDVTVLFIESTYTSEWAHWVRIAESAFLAGKFLVIDTHATTVANCRPYQLSMGQ